MAIGASFVITKKGLNQASDRHGFEGEGFAYLRSPIWWAGIVALVIGESANFAAYAFAPAILVTPLGALSVLIGAVLGSYFLKEKLGVLGKLGCALSLLGSVIIVLHAPPDKPVESVDEILDYATQLVKAFGIALKLTLEGNNQFTRPSTYMFAIVVCGCVLTQMNYFNKALSQFSTSIVNPLYYVTFTTATLCASFILFHGFNTSDSVNTISLLCGFLIIFTGVYLLNMSRSDPDGKGLVEGTGSFDDDAIPTDAIAGLQTRRSLQIRRSGDRAGLGNRRSGSSFSLLMGNGPTDRDGLMRNYDAESLAGASDYGDEERHVNGFGDTNGINGAREMHVLKTSFDSPRNSDVLTSSPTVTVTPLTHSASSHRRSRTASSVHYKMPSTPKIDEHPDEPGSR
ncbi:hypothetical protein KEM56_005522 [Ascosphaera pollenicola]|nr:hypothetical protein KEM56_005522 [Ascosphaera pollenicola]